MQWILILSGVTLVFSHIRERNFFILSIHELFGYTQLLWQSGLLLSGGELSCEAAEYCKTCSQQCTSPPCYSCNSCCFKLKKMKSTHNVAVTKTRWSGATSWRWGLFQPKLFCDPVNYQKLTSVLESYNPSGWRQGLPEMKSIQFPHPQQGYEGEEEMMMMMIHPPGWWHHLGKWCLVLEKPWSRWTAFTEHVRQDTQFYLINNTALYVSI